MKNLILLVGPPGSGKSSLCSQYPGHIRISQDDQGKTEHLKLFQAAIDNGKDVIVDRLNFSIFQRQRYLTPAKEAGYTTKIVVLHVKKATCVARCNARLHHPTIKTPEDTSRAIHGFFKNYERVQDSEADVVERLGWDGPKQTAIVYDIDGTMANIDHRLHYVRGSDDITDQKKDWKTFFQQAINDVPHKWCQELFWQMQQRYRSIFVSARPDDYKGITQTWLDRNNLIHDGLFLRERNDYRKDSIIKEIILDFELLTQYDILFVVDDRKTVVDMFRGRGITVLHCNYGEF